MPTAKVAITRTDTTLGTQARIHVTKYACGTRTGHFQPTKLCTAQVRILEPNRLASVLFGMQHPIIV